MSTYTFIERDILNTAILPDEPENVASYITKTTYRSGLVGPKVTSLIPTANSPGNTLDGEIDWKRQTFSIAGLATRWEELRSKPEGITDSTREWRWIGKRFMVKYKDNTWLARVGSPYGPVDATFTIRQSRILHQSNPATIAFSSGVSARDRLFLLMVMI
ncbi:hypothetical protein D9615_009860 [Tricholomella constricta]|uniref:Uncharacterized protein n=1 Tax=Tricholomella constricta TaxID=117010 RepID=A0A8H5GX31_9AGAR|nr:hypothetical protein D9615_009860 [Tricholomella constricta]